MNWKNPGKKEIENFYLQQSPHPQSAKAHIAAVHFFTKPHPKGEEKGGKGGKAPLRTRPQSRLLFSFLLTDL